MGPGGCGSRGLLVERVVDRGGYTLFGVILNPKILREYLIYGDLHNPFVPTTLDPQPRRPTTIYFLIGCRIGLI